MTLSSSIKFPCHDTKKRAKTQKKIGVVTLARTSSYPDFPLLFSILYYSLVLRTVSQLIEHLKEVSLIHGTDDRLLSIVIDND